MRDPSVQEMALRSRSRSPHSSHRPRQPAARPVSAARPSPPGPNGRGAHRLLCGWVRLRPAVILVFVRLWRLMQGPMTLDVWPVHHAALNRSADGLQITISGGCLGIDVRPVSSICGSKAFVSAIGGSRLPLFRCRSLQYEIALQGRGRRPDYSPASVLR